MVAMIAFVTFLLLVQITPGVPFDASKHPNPIVTYVGSNDFKPATYEDVEKRSEIELIGLSRQEGQRIGLEMADAGKQKIEIMRRDVEVMYYPVVRQKYTLTGGGEFILYAFRNPKSPVPPEILNGVAFQETKKPEDGRFGLAPKPERLDVRGEPGLLFDKNGELTVFWQEEGVTYVAAGKLAREEMFRLIEDLL
jgi:hypothetical protein